MIEDSQHCPCGEKWSCYQPRIIVKPRKSSPARYPAVYEAAESAKIPEITHYH